MLANEKIVRAGGIDYFSNNIIECIINPTDICNFKCSYCCNRKSRTNRTLDVTILEGFVQDLGERNASSYIFYVTGGEPLLYKHLHELVLFINRYIPNKKRIDIITNGSILHKNIEYYKKYNDIEINYCISLHIEQIEVETYVHNLLTIKDLSCIKCKILLYPGKLDVAKRLCNIFKNIGIKVHISAVFDEYSNALEYNNDEIKFLESFSSSTEVLFFHEFENIYGIRRNKNYNRIDKRFSPEKFSYKGMLCAATMNTFRLGPDGIVVPCFGFMRHGIRFDLKERRLRDIPELRFPCICPDDRCNCELFLQTPKWRDAVDAPAWFFQEGAQV